MQESGLNNSKKVAYFEYDFYKHGGVIGDITVQGDVIPKGAIINGGLIHSKIAPVGSGATVAIEALSSEDLLAATAITNLALNAMLAVVPVPQTNTTWIRATSNITSLTFTIANTVLTAGKIVVALEYVVTV